MEGKRGEVQLFPWAGVFSQTIGQVCRVAPHFSGRHGFTKSLGGSHNLQILVSRSSLHLTFPIHLTLPLPESSSSDPRAAYSLDNSTAILLSGFWNHSKLSSSLFNHEVASAKAPFLRMLPTDYIRLGEQDIFSMMHFWNPHLEYISPRSPGMRYFISACSWFTPYCVFYDSCIWAWSFYFCENVKSMKAGTSSNLSVISHST